MFLVYAKPNTGSVQSIDHTTLGPTIAVPIITDPEINSLLPPEPTDTEPEVNLNGAEFNLIDDGQ